MTPVTVETSPEGVPGAVTDPTRLSAEDISYESADGTPVKAYLAVPAGEGSHPGMIVIHEAGGLGEHIRDVCNRFANLGYVTIGVDLYTREGGPPQPPGDIDAIMARLFSMSDATVLGDLEGAAAYLRSRTDVRERIGCIGFCMGGRYTLLFAGSTASLSAAVDCWGGFVDRATPEEATTPLRPTPPLDLAANIRCPLLAAVGREDHNPSPEIGERLRERAAESGQEVKVDVYEDAGHAFFADYRPSYRPAPAAALWAEVVPFLSRHLGGD
jgi:carboxymethylenebutenolidase